MRRSQFDAGSQPVRNLATNPSAKTVASGVGTIQRTNLAPNPEFATTSGTAIVRTNLLTNPKLETTGSTNVTVRTNLATNPGMEAGSGTVAVRTNLVSSSRGVSALTGYGAQTITANVAISGHPEGFATALRVTYGSTGSNPGVLLVDSVVSGDTYFMSAWVYHETYVGGAVAFTQQAVDSQPIPPAVVVGEWRKVSWIATASGTSGLGYRISSQAGAGSWLITGMQVEKSTIALPYFDALTTTTNRAVNPSMEDLGTTTTLRTNMITNPNYVGTGGWTSIAASLSADATKGDGNVIKVVSTGTATRMAAVAMPASTSSGTYSISASAATSSSLVTGFRFILYNSSTAEILTSTSYPVVSDGIFRDFAATLSTTFSFDRVYFEFVGTAITSGTVGYIDKTLMEIGSVPGTYFDGSTAASGDFTYAWTGTANASTSTQKASAVAYWANRWFGSSGGSGYTYRSGGTGMNGGYSFRKVWTTANTSSSLDVGISIQVSVTEGSTYTSSIYQKSSIDQSLTCFVQWLDKTGATISSTSKPVTATPANTWVRGSTTVTAPAGATSAWFIFGPYTNSVAMPAGSYIDWDWAMVEESPVLRVYQDGTAAAPGDFTYGWAGTINNSASQQKGVPVTGYGQLNAIITQSTDWVGGGSKSLRVTPTSTISKDSCAAVTFSMVTGKTYTFSVMCRVENVQPGTPDTRARRVAIYHSGTVVYSNTAPNAIGSYPLSVTFTVTDAAQYQSIRLYNGVYAGEGDIWWDNLLIEEADHVMPYFDGSTTAAQDVTHAWSGTAHASTSLMRVSLPSLVSNSGARYGMLSTEWAARGSKSVKVSHLFAAGGTNNDQFAEIHNMISGGLTANTTYTISGTCRTTQVLGGTLSSVAMQFLLNMGGNIPITYKQTKPNTAGVSRVVGTFTTGASTSINFLRIMSGASYGNGDVWWDELCLEEGATDGSYFDGGYSAKENLVKASATALSVTQSSGVAFSGQLWTRASATAAASGTGIIRQYVNLSDLSQGAPYTVSVTLANDQAYPQQVSFDWCDVGITSVTLSAGEVRRISGTVSRLTYDSTFRFSDIEVYKSPTEGRSILFKDWLVERGPTLGEYYTGSELTARWTGTADASTSDLTAPSLVGYASATYGKPFQSKIAPSVGANSAGVQTRGNNGDGVYLQDIDIAAGTSYTLSSWIKITETIPGFHGVLRWKDTAQNIIYDTVANVVSSLVVGTWVRVSVTAVAPTGATKLQPLWRTLISGVPATTFYVSGVLVEASPVVSTFFTGATAATGDFSHAWGSTAHNSVSNQLSTTVVGQTSAKSGGALDAKFRGYQSTAEDGAKIMRWVAPAGTATAVWRVAGINSAGWDYSKVKAGGQYTLLFRWRSSGWPSGLSLSTYVQTPQATNAIYTGSSAALNQTGWQEFRKTFTALRDGDASQIIYLSLPVLPSTSTDGIFDVRDWMLVEGAYSGDFIDGGKPLSKWEGSANASTSLGYPQQFLDIAGKPILDYSAAGTYTLDDSFGPTEGRTFYTVMENLAEIFNAANPMINYGENGLSDAIPYSWIQYRQDGDSSSPNGTNNLFARRTGANGISRNVTIGSHVSAWGLTGTGTIFHGVDGAPVGTDTQVLSVPHQKIAVLADNVSQKHIRTIAFRGVHDAATRLAISRYLGNKYGANVA